MTVNRPGQTLTAGNFGNDQAVEFTSLLDGVNDNALTGKLLRL